MVVGVVVVGDLILSFSLSHPISVYTLVLIGILKCFESYMI